VGKGLRRRLGARGRSEFRPIRWLQLSQGEPHLADAKRLR